MKKLLLFCFLFWPVIVTAQNFTDKWDGYFSFYNIKDLAYGSGYIYTAAENALFTTNINNGLQKKITTLQGLSGNTISALRYVEAYNALLIGYENGLIQLYDLTAEKTYTFVDILQKPTLAPPQKRINGFFIGRNTVFIATNYGISEFSVARKEFGDTYFIGTNGGALGVNAVVILDGEIYAATQGGGLKHTRVNNPNIINYNQWQQLESGIFKNVVVFHQNLYAMTQANQLKQLQGNSLVTVRQFSQNLEDIKVTPSYLTLTFHNHVKVFNPQLAEVAHYTASGIPTNLCTGLAYNDQLYIGDKTFGLFRKQLGQSGTHPTPLSPNGPLRNAVFSLDLVPHELWVSYGTYNLYYTPSLDKRGVSHYKDGHWTNIPYSDLPPIRPITSVGINPQNVQQVFFASYHDGLLEIQDHAVANFYTAKNSSLSPSDNMTDDQGAVRLGPLAFDAQGNLWFGNALSTDGLIQLPAGGDAHSFVKFDMSDILSTPKNNNGFSSLLIDRQDNIYMGSYKDGVIGYNPETQHFAKVKGGQNEGNLPSNYISSLALDHNYTLWIGTDRGLRVLYNPARMFKDPNLQADNIVFPDDEGVPQELFAGLSITAIAVDGKNNKWVGSTAGAYYITADGQKTIHHFTTANSPLPSNSINAIKIDGATGKVYIATQKGLVAYRGSATAPADNLNHLRAYPNPVRPTYHGVVTIDGLMENANVKITDIEGNLVYEKIAEGGSIQWNTTAFGSYKVASGVYLVMVTSKDQQHTKVIKIMIIR